ncbi:MAG: PqqD family protein [Gemmatimonadales bacterium]
MNSPATTTTLPASSRFTRAQGVVSTQQCDTTVLLDVNGGLYYTLNEVGGRIWGMIGEKASVAEMVKRLAGEFDAPAERLDADTGEMIVRLLRARLVERTG